MDSAFQDALSILTGAGYRIRVQRATPYTLYFEDNSTIGLCRVFPTASEIIREWEQVQDSFVRVNAGQLSRDPDKAWNVYTVLLSKEEPTAPEVPALASVEEDFRGTRKIARGGIASRNDVVQALLPLLPIQNVLSISIADGPGILRKRLRAINPLLEVLLGDEAPEVIASAFLERE